MDTYRNVGKKINSMQNLQYDKFSNFLEPDRSKLGNLLTGIYDSCTVFSSDPEVEMCTTTEKSYEIMLKLYY